MGKMCQDGIMFERTVGLRNVKKCQQRCEQYTTMGCTARLDFLGPKN